MRKLISLSFFLATALTLVACSSKEQGLSQQSELELYSQSQTALQDGSYSQAIRHLEDLDKSYPDTLYKEQIQLNLIYAYYKAQDYTKALMTADRFIKVYPQSPHLDYVIYMAGLTNFASGENFFQDLFKVDRATRESTSMKAAFANFQTLVQYFPNSPYTKDAVARMAYIKAGLARHELEIAKFYAKRQAHIAVANRVVGMWQQFPDTQATLDALPLMKIAYEKMGLSHLAKQAEQLIIANQGKIVEHLEKPEAPELALPQ